MHKSRVANITKRQEGTTGASVAKKTKIAKSGLRDASWTPRYVKQNGLHHRDYITLHPHAMPKNNSRSPIWFGRRALANTYHGFEFSVHPFRLKLFVRNGWLDSNLSTSTATRWTNLFICRHDSTKLTFSSTCEWLLVFNHICVCETCIPHRF